MPVGTKRAMEGTLSIFMLPDAFDYFIHFLTVIKTIIWLILLLGHRNYFDQILMKKNERSQLTCSM